MSEASKCRSCGQEIYWHRAKSGKNYPTNSADNRRDFHQCRNASSSAPSNTQARPVTITNAAPVADSSPLEATVEERVSHLEKQIREMYRLYRELQAKIPITQSDVGF
jgi:hypothetical protein